MSIAEIEYTVDEMMEIINLSGAPGQEIRAYVAAHPDWRDRLKALELILAE